MKNPPLESIPEHLREYTTTQNPSLYTAMDQASWRYVMRVSKAFFSKHAHPLYLAGLEATGISIEHIPLIQEMDTALRRLGWRAVAINGFIPPSVFLEFQSLRILAIACDIRKLENLGYTPSPDIIHEAAGHAPIVADPSYRAYLEAYGEVARNAIITKYDLDLYNAILALSEVKEDPSSTPAQINMAQKTFEQIAAQEKKPSEAAMLARMAWWTTEYGLVGSIEKPLIYGAGLLSSVSESFHCLSSEVKKIPFNLKESLATSYDITRPQPQLFVAKSFDELSKALDEFANEMSFRKGGVYGLTIAQEAENTVTAVLDNGIQLTGIVTSFGANEAAEETHFILTGPKQVSYLNEASEDLPGRVLPQDLFVPLFDKSVSAARLEDLQRKVHGSGLVTKAGFRIQGRLKKEVSIKGLGRAYLIEQVKITDTLNKVIYEERSKVFPLFLATKVVSVFGGAADRKEFSLRNSTRGAKVKSHKTNLTEENNRLNDLYQIVRNFREQENDDVQDLQEVFKLLMSSYPEDWLLRLELLELFQKHAPENVITAQLRQQLVQLAESQPQHQELIRRGVELL